METKPKVQKMHCDAVEIAVRDRASWFARDVHPSHTAKELQRRYGLTPAQAERILLGRGSWEAIARMARGMGINAFAAIFGVPGGPDLSGVLGKMERVRLLAEEHDRLAGEVRDALARLEDGSILHGQGGASRDIARPVAGASVPLAGAHPTVAAAAPRPNRGRG